MDIKNNNQKPTPIRRSTYSREQYEGHDNIEIIYLLNDLNNKKNEIREIEEKIAEIQNNCIHLYKFRSQGAYEDSFTCELCGHDDWK